MVFHVRWISLTTRSSPNRTLVTSDSGGIRMLVVRKIHLTWETIQNAYLPITISFIKIDIHVMGLVIAPEHTVN